MHKIPLGQTGLLISAVGFGGIPIQRLPEQKAVDVVVRCLELGVTFLDTAIAYTTSEERIGKAITGRREGLVLATKTQAREAEGVAQHLDLSLERLAVKTIDLYQFHCVSTDEDYGKVLAPGGPFDFVREARAAGKVNHIGLTSHSMEIALRAARSGHFETIMFPFNFITNEAAEELIPLALERDVGLIAMKPMAGGALERADLAFKYLRQFPQILPIPGIQREEEMEEIVAIMEGPAELTCDEQESIERMRNELGNRFCRRCGYCEPCPNGVPTQALMILDSMIRRFPLEVVSANYAEALDAVESCTSCGECEEKCPYGLPIRDMIQEHAELLSRHQVEAGLIE